MATPIHAPMRPNIAFVWITGPSLTGLQWAKPGFEWFAFGPLFTLSKHSFCLCSTFPFTPFQNHLSPIPESPFLRSPDPPFPCSRIPFPPFPPPLFLCYPITLLPRYPVTPLPRYPVTPLPRYPVTPLPRYPVTPLPRSHVTLLPCSPVTG
jgi:hypothetical protein